MTSNIFMPLAKIPDMAELTIDHLDALAELQQIYANLRNRPSVAHIIRNDYNSLNVISAGEISIFSGLRCRLSKQFISQNGLRLRENHKTEREEKIYNKLITYNNSGRLLNSLNIRSISRVSSAVGGLGQRHGAIYSRSDSDGYRIVYPNVEIVPGRMADIRSLISRYSQPYPILCAIVALVLFYNCHPLRDGNGRVGRIIYNIILSESGGYQYYIPLAELIDASCGGFNYCTRMAWLHGEWTDVVNWFLESGRITSRYCSEITSRL